MKKTHFLFLLIGLFTSFNLVFGQAPNISYAVPLSYTVGTLISPITPGNSGGAVPGIPYGQTTFLAGSGNGGFANGNGAAASFNSIWGITVDLNQNVYVADFLNTHLRKITPQGDVSTYGSINEYFAGVAVDFAGNVYTSGIYTNRILKITPAGVVSVLAGSSSNTSGYADGTGASASFNQPAAMTSDGTNVYVVDQYSHMIRKITPGGVVTTILSSINIETIAADVSGNIYYKQNGANSPIMKLPVGSTTPLVLAGNGVAGYADGPGATASFNGPAGLAVDGAGNVYVADAGNNRIREITPAGIVVTLAGSGALGTANGSGTTATFSGPGGVAADGSGNAYVLDGNNVIRKVVATGYTISPALPDGLIMNPVTGIISGMTNVALTAKSYIITAFNASGSSTTVLNTPPIIAYPGLQIYVTGAAIKIYLL